MQPFSWAQQVTVDPGLTRRGLGLRILLCMAALLLALGARPALALSEADLLEPERAFAFSAVMAAPDLLKLHYQIAPGYYMYRERFDLQASQDGVLRPQSAVYPKGDTKYDPTFEKDMEVYHNSVAIQVPLVAGQQPLRVTVTSQGCADAGVCYPPMDSAIQLEPVAGGYALAMAGASRQPVQAAAKDPGAASLLAAGDLGLADAIGGLGWLKTAGVFLLLGLLLAFTPCVLPMIPILSSIVLVGHGQVRPTRWRGLGLAGAYVLGMSLVYTALGVAAGLSGAGLAAWLQKPWVLTLFALLLAVLALAMFGAFNFQMPARVQERLNDRARRIPGGRGTGALLMGALSALIVGPCVAAPLAGALLYISQTGDVLLGGAALFAMAWGMGMPLLMVGATSGALLPKAGPWMDGVKRLFGLLLLATAWWMMISVVPDWAQLLGWAVLAMVGAVMLRAFEPIAQDAGTLRMFSKGAGILLALIAALWVLAVASGGRDALQPLGHLFERGAPRVATQAASGALPPFQRVRSSAELDAVLAQSRQPVMLDFYADWCVSCREMERFTFSDPDVARRMAGMLLLQADVTENNEQDRALLKRFRLFGPPGILFFEAGGREIPEARVIGFKDAGSFKAVLDSVLKP